MKPITAAIMIALCVQSVLAKGTVTYPSIYSESLHLNKFNAVYLPEGYNPTGTKRYPVIYFLHGAYQNHGSNMEILASALDKMIAEGTIQPFILVAPDGNSPKALWGGSFWVNSALYGLTEDYVTKDLVAFIDSSYLTLPVPEARVMMGFSDGGEGAMILGLKHTDVYRSIVVYGGIADWDYLVRDMLCTGMLSETTGPPYNYSPSKGFWSETVFRVAGAFTPNLKKQPYKVDLPYDESGNVVEEVLARWQAFSTAALVATLAPEQIPDIFFSCGTGDWLNYQATLNEKNALDELGIPYTFVPFSGGHELRANDAFLHIESVVSKLMSIQHGQPQMISNVILYDNYPNPFNPSTTISFELPHDGLLVQLVIFNCNGGYVTTLVDSHFNSGHHQVIWNGLDQQGNKVSSGMYIYRLRAGNFMITKKMTLVK